MRKKMYSGANLLVAFCVLSVTYSCDDRDVVKDGHVPVSFTSEIKGSQPASRAVNMSWTTGDELGICMFNAGSGLSANTVFNRYNVSGSGQKASIIPVASDQTLYYPTDGSDVNFIAFSPYKEITGSTISYSEFSDQSTLDKVEAVDFLYHKGTEAYNRTSSNAMLTFTHKLSKLTIKASAAEDAASAAIPLNTLVMKIGGVPASFSANLSNGVLTPSLGTGTTTAYHTDGTFERIATAIIIPHGAKGGRTISFSLSDGSSFVYDMPSDYVFESGKAYELEFTLTREGAELMGSKINDWVDGNENWNMSYGLNLNMSEVEISISGGDYFISFETSYTGGVSVKYSTSPADADAGIPDWIELVGSLEATSALGETTYKSKFRVRENLPYRIGYVHVVAGKTVKVIPVRQGYDIAESSNCIVMRTGGLSVAMPVRVVSDVASYPNIDLDPIYTYIDPFLTKTSYDVKVLWVDSPAFGDVSRSTVIATDIIVGVGKLINTLDGNCYLTVTPGTKEGNAVVCITDPDTGHIIWSWHIWVLNPIDRATIWVDGSSENTIPEKPAPTANGYAFMPLNLGAFNGTAEIGAERKPIYGLYYQWGRKDPAFDSYPTVRSSASMMHGNLGSLPSAGVLAITGKRKGLSYNEVYDQDFSGLVCLQHPYNFESCPNVDDDFNKFRGTIPVDEITNNSWGYSSNYPYATGKSPFDPCPAGWRVPPGPDLITETENEISAWSNINKVELKLSEKDGCEGYFVNGYGGFFPLENNGMGHYWGSNPYNGNGYDVANGYNLYFYKQDDVYCCDSHPTGDCYGRNYLNRSEGHFVRCVTE